MNFLEWMNENDIKNWLGSSVVTQPVFHGTNKPFDKFAYQTGRRYVLFSTFEVQSKGFFFAENPHDALNYGDHVVTCYVRMMNPLVDPRRDRHLGVDRLPAKKEADLVKILSPMIQYENGVPFIDIGIGKHWLHDRNDEHENQWIYSALDFEGLAFDVLDNPECVSIMTQLGYDGTFVDEPNQHISRSIFVPSPDQIMMVTWSRGSQPEWGHNDDYRTQKIDGVSQFSFTPDLR